MKAALRAGGLAALYLVLGLLLTRPLGSHFTTGIPYTRTADAADPVKHAVLGDHFQVYYRFWLFGDVLAGNSAPFENKYEFSVAPGAARPLWGYFLPYPLLFAAARPLGGAAGYNAALLASFLFSGLALYLLVRHYTGDRLAAAVGGAAFAASGYRLTSLLSGHPLGFSLFLLPLFLYCLERLLATRSRRAALAAGFALLLLGDNDLHVLYLTALCAPLFVLAHFSARAPRGWAAEARALLVPGLLLALFAAGALALKLPLLSETGLAAAPARPLQQVSALAPTLGAALDRGNPVQSTYVYPGAAACAAALAGLLLAAGVARRPGEGRAALRRMLFFAALFAGAYVLAFGPSFPLGAPYRALYDHLPKFSLLRQSSKLMGLASFALAVLAGLGVAALRRRLPGRAGAAAAGAVLLAVVADGSGWPGPGAGITLLPGSVPAYTTSLRGEPEARVVNVPVWPGDDAWSSLYQYYATLYRTVMVNGYLPVPPAGYQEQVVRPLAGLNAGQVDARRYELLRSMGVGYLIFHQEAFPAKACLFPSQFALDGLLASPYLALAAGEAPVWVFRIRAPGEVGARAPRFPSSAVGVAVPLWLAVPGQSRDDAEAASGRSLGLGPEARQLTLQPPRATPAGSYRLSVNLRPAGAARLRLSARLAKGGLLAARSFDEGGAGYRAVTLDFTLPEAADVAYHLEKEAGAPLALDWLHLRFADREEPISSFEFDELYHLGNVRPFAGASKGTALRLAAADPLGQVTRGPYRLLGAGAWALTLSLGYDAAVGLPPERAVGAVALRTHLDEYGKERERPEGLILPERVICAGELSGAAPLTELTLPFTLARPTFLSVDVRHLRHGLVLDRATLRRVGE